MSAAKPHCFLCEAAIEPGEPFKVVQAWQHAAPSRALPAKPGGTGLRIVQRGVHYSCELEAIAVAAAAGAGDDPPEMVVEGAEDEDLTTREKLARLMGGALDLVDFFDELLP